MGYGQYSTTVRPNTISLLDARLSDPILAILEKYEGGGERRGRWSNGGRGLGRRGGCVARSPVFRGDEIRF